MKLKVALVFPELGKGGGIETIIRFLIEKLQAEPDIEFQLFSLSTSSKDPASSSLFNPASWFKQPSFKTLKLDNNQELVHIGSPLRELEPFRYRQRRELNDRLKNFQIVQVVGGFPAWANVIKIRKNQSTFVWMATLSSWERKTALLSNLSLKNVLRLILSSYTAYLDKKIIRSSHHLIVMNDKLKKYISDKFNKKTILLSPGVDSVKFKANDKSSSKKYFLGVGRFSDERKNPKLLLEAFQKIASSVPENLVLAGSSPPPDEFWSRVNELNLEERVKFIHLPSQKELLRLYQEATTLVLSSNEEGFGIVVIESMSCQTPVISTKCGGPESIINDSIDGFLTELYDSEEISSRMLLLSSDKRLREEMGKRARKKDL